MGFCRALMTACTPEERENILHGGAVPEWWNLRQFFDHWPGTSIKNPSVPEAPVPETPLTLKRCIDRGFDFFYTVHKDEYKVIARRKKRQRRFAGLTLTEVAKKLAWPVYSALPKAQKIPYTSHLGDKRPLTVLTVTESETTKVPPKELAQMGENWVDLMSSWSPPQEQCHTCGAGFALRAISSAVATHNGHKPSKKLKEALGTSLL